MAVPLGPRTPLLVITAFVACILIAGCQGEPCQDYADAICACPGQTSETAVCASATERASRLQRADDSGGPGNDPANLVSDACAVELERFICGKLTGRSP